MQWTRNNRELDDTEHKTNPGLGHGQGQTGPLCEEVDSYPDGNEKPLSGEVV